MAKSKDTRIDSFRDEALGFITDHFSDMETAFQGFMDKKEYGMAVSLYMQLVTKVIPSLPTQEVAENKNDKPDWMRNIDNAKKTIEKTIKDSDTDDDK